VHASFLLAIELHCIWCQKQEKPYKKNLVQETETDMLVSCAIRLVKDFCTSFLTVCHQPYFICILICTAKFLLIFVVVNAGVLCDWWVKLWENNVGTKVCDISWHCCIYLSICFMFLMSWQWRQVNTWWLSVTDLVFVIGFQCHLQSRRKSEIGWRHWVSVNVLLME